MVSDSLSDVRKVELFIKKQKSRKFLEMIIDRSNNKEFIHEIIKKSLAYSGPDASGLIRRS